jgi:hypothetical protein
VPKSATATLVLDLPAEEPDVESASSSDDESDLIPISIVPPLPVTNVLETKPAESDDV